MLSFKGWAVEIMASSWDLLCAEKYVKNLIEIMRKWHEGLGIVWDLWIFRRLHDMLMIMEISCGVADYMPIES